MLVGESKVEFLFGMTPKSKYGRLACEKRQGLHHVCFEVDDIKAALVELRGKGVKLRDEVPRIEHQGSRIAFLDPESTGNVLIELVQL